MDILLTGFQPAARRLAQWLMWCVLAIGLTACGGGDDGPTAPSITTQPASVTVTAGATASFSVTANGTGPLAYQWQKNGTAIDGATAASYTTPVTTTADTGTLFAVVVSNAAGTITSSAATLTVDQAVAPSIVTQPQAQSVVEPATATFTVAANGSDPLSYQWTRNGAVIAGANAASYTTAATTVAADDGAQYAVTVSNVAGSATSDNAKLTVTAAPTPVSITTQPASKTVNAGQTATFGVVASGTAPLTYQWSKNGSAIAGATGTSYTTPATVEADSGSTFRVVVTNPVGSVPSADAALTVTPSCVMPTITAQPASVSVNAGQAASFSVTATGSATLTYQWKRGGAAIAGATAATYTIANTTAADNGAQFTVTVANLCGSVTSDIATLTVNLSWTGIRQDGAPLPTAATQLAFDAAKAVATDAQGNVVIGGYTSGTFSAGAGSGAYKPFIAKYSAAGALMWARLVLDGSNGFGVLETVSGVSVDGAGNIYVTGQTLTTLAGEVAAGGLDVFVAKFDASGNRLWAHQFGSASTDTPTGIAVDSNGNAFIVGITNGQLPQQAPPFGTSSYFIGKYDATGNRVWLVQDVFDAAHPVPYNEGHGVAVDAAGNAYLAGFTQSQTGGAGAYVVKFSGGGARQWETKFTGAAPNDGLPVTPDGLAVSADGGSVFVAGRTYADFDTAGNPPVAPLCCATGDAFVARFNGAGSLQWVHNLSSQTGTGPRYFDDEAFGVATDTAGSAVFITGYTAGVMPNETTKGAEDVFVARYEPDGTRSWVRQLGSSLPATAGGAQNDRAFGIALDLHGDLFVAGVTHGTFGTPLRNTDRDDWFVFKMKPTDGSLY